MRYRNGDPLMNQEQQNGNNTQGDKIDGKLMV
jgi:hypothetical protein